MFDHTFCSLESTVIKGAFKKEKFTVSCSLYCRNPSGLYSLSLCSGLHRHLAVDICIEQRGQLEIQPNFWLCSCQLERERHREFQVCLLQFSFHLKIAVDAHISDMTLLWDIYLILTYYLEIGFWGRTTVPALILSNSWHFTRFICVLYLIRPLWLAAACNQLICTQFPMWWSISPLCRTAA